MQSSMAPLSLKIVRGVNRLERPLAHPVVALGNFDGVHLGHCRIFEKTVERARLNRGIAAVLTFEPHPLSVLAPEKAPPLLTRFEKKMSHIGRCGIEIVICEEFTREYAQIPARDFVRSVLVEGVGAKEVVVGAGYAFGRGREGSARLLEEWGRDFGFALHVVEPLSDQGRIISSSRIREAIQSGDMPAASALLGRPYELSGTVVSGDLRGVKLGFPTANIDTGDMLIPAEGVYAAFAIVEGRDRHAVVNIGRKPTFGENRPLSVEVHIMNFSGDLYGREIGLLFAGRLRDEIRFASADELSRQIARDVQAAATLLDEYLL